MAINYGKDILLTSKNLDVYADSMESSVAILERLQYITNLNFKKNHNRSERI